MCGLAAAICPGVPTVLGHGYLAQVFMACEALSHPPNQPTHSQRWTGMSHVHRNGFMQRGLHNHQQLRLAKSASYNLNPSTIYNRAVPLSSGAWSGRSC